MLLPVFHGRIEYGCDPVLVQANDPDIAVGVQILGAVGPVNKARKMTVIERRPMCVIEAPNATFGDDNRAIQLLKTLNNAPSDLDVGTDFQVEVRQPAPRHLVGETLGILDRHLHRAGS